MTEEDREILVKEARLNALHDVQMALARLMDDHAHDDSVRQVAKIINHYIGQRISDVSSGAADRINVTHTLWGEH